MAPPAVVPCAIEVTAPVPTPRRHRWTRRALPWILRSAGVPDGVQDAASGFRAYRVAVLKKALAERNGDPLLSHEGWAANVELLLAVAPHTRRLPGADGGGRDRVIGEEPAENIAGR